MSPTIEQAEVAIIGGGVIGCGIAWRLSQAGLRVVVIERGEPGGEASHAAGGMLAPLAEADRADDFFHLTVRSRAMYADFARELQAASGLDIEYRTEGTLYLALTEEDEAQLDHRWHWQHAAGLNVKRLNADCVRRLEPLVTEKLRWALKFPDDHQVDNRKLATALAEAARASGVVIQSNTEFMQLMIESQAGQSKVIGVQTTKGEVRAQTVVMAAGSWSKLLTHEAPTGLPTVIEPVRGQMIALTNPGPALSHVIYSSRGYLVPRRSGLIIAGSTTERVGYDKRITAGGIASIIAHAIEIAPHLSEQAIVETWAGLRPHAPDALPVLGCDPQVKGLIYATGHYRNGILLTPITAKAISELVIKGESSISLAPFSPARFVIGSAA